MHIWHNLSVALAFALSSVHLLNSFSRSLSHAFSFSFPSPFPSVFVCLYFPVFFPSLSSQSPRSADKKASYSTQFGIETNRSRRGSKQRIAPHASHVGRHPCPYCCSHFPQSFSHTCPLASFLSNCGFCIPVSESNNTPQRGWASGSGYQCVGGSVPPFLLVDGLCEGTVLGVDDDGAPPAKRKRLELGLPPRLRAHNASATSLLAQEEPEHGMIARGSAVGSETTISMATQIAHRLAHPRSTALPLMSLKARVAVTFTSWP